MWPLSSQVPTCFRTGPLTGTPEQEGARRPLPSLRKEKEVQRLCDSQSPGGRKLGPAVGAETAPAESVCELGPALSQRIWLWLRQLLRGRILPLPLRN